MQNAHLNATLQTLEKLESLFHAACADATAAGFERIVSPDFWEVGASGKTYTREFALAVLKNRPTTPPQVMWKTDNFAVKQVGQNVFLLTYTLIQPERITKRLTVWHYTEYNWQAMYHQGTVVCD
jgi:hypothetical protein